MKHKPRNAETETQQHESWRELLRNKVKHPVCVVLGAPRRAAGLARALAETQPVLYQMDLFQANRLSDLLKEGAATAKVELAADLWDLRCEFQTVIFPVEPGGERALKLDIIEQAYHILRPQGTLIVLSEQEQDQLFPVALKKIYGRVHLPPSDTGTILWCQRGEEARKRRRHEVTFHVSRGDGPSFRFLSQPGTFSYGRFDNGARALVETAVVNPGERVLDLGCGCGTNGIICGLRGHVTFVDSNVRATALTEFNAKANGLDNYDIKAQIGAGGLPPSSFDVVLANPPYYANLEIAQHFIKDAHAVLKDSGKLYLVTKQPAAIGPMMADLFDSVEAVERRGYVVFCGAVCRPL